MNLSPEKLAVAITAPWPLCAVRDAPSHPPPSPVPHPPDHPDTIHANHPSPLETIPWLRAPTADVPPRATNTNDGNRKKNRGRNHTRNPRARRTFLDLRYCIGRLRASAGSVAGGARGGRGGGVAWGLVSPPIGTHHRMLLHSPSTFVSCSSAALRSGLLFSSVGACTSHKRVKSVGALMSSAGAGGRGSFGAPTPPGRRGTPEASWTLLLSL